MLRLGIKTISPLNEELNKPIFKDSQINIVELHGNKQLEHLDGLLIIMDKENQLTEIITWLVLCQKYPKMFVWVLSKAPLDMEKTILMRLGANEIITADCEPDYLQLIIENSFKRIAIRYCKINDIPDTPKEELMNEQNQSIYVNGSEKTLTRKEFKIMSILYDNLNNTVSYEHIMKELYPDKPQTNFFLIANNICHLRNKLKTSRRFVIKTTRSKGYVLKTL